MVGLSAAPPFAPEPYSQLSNDEVSLTSAIGSLRMMPSGWFYQNMLTFPACTRLYSTAVDEQAHRVFPDISDAGGGA